GMRGLERGAFAACVSEQALQARAGAAMAEEVFRLSGTDSRVVVLVGHGNNGRDGAVAAQWLLEHGALVDLVLAPRHAITPEELRRLRAAGARTTTCGDQAAVDEVLGGAK